ncbi:MAG: SDR family oxidoreductase [Rhodospirillales bacterium]|jgi:3-oxoacyl-[acyl-carrier protein] reductase|nr:SDR family oxidoreductase [Rhodospirillales bacterium]
MADIGTSDERDISGRVVIITGGGQGIGRQYALSFAQAGAIPVIADINTQNAQRVEREVSEAGGQGHALEVDVGGPESCIAMARQVEEKYGRIDVLINNAALFSSLSKHAFDEIPLGVWNDVMNVNVSGPFHCARAVVPIMRKAGWGRVINISSSSVALGNVNYLHYVTPKSAMLGMTNALAREVGKSGITVNCITPSATTTEVEREGFTDETAKRVAANQCIPNPATPGDLIGLAMFLASPASAFVTGQTIAANGGLTHG